MKMKKRLLNGLVAGTTIATALMAGNGCSAGETDIKTASTEIYVSPSGDDKNDGSKAKPFATLERARDAARELRKTGAGDGPVRIVLAVGRYRQSEPLNFTAEDKNLVIQADTGASVSITGDIEIPLERMTVVSDEQTLARLLPEARGKVLQASLEGLGIERFGDLGPRGFGRTSPSAPHELVINDKIQSISQWPNAGEPRIRMGQVFDKGSVPRAGETPDRGGVFGWNTDRPLRWKQAEDLYLYGLFNAGFADDLIPVESMDFEKKTFKLAHPHLYGLKSAKSFNAYVAYNLLEELDRPGEYFIDKKKAMVYFYPDVDRQDVRSLRLTHIAAPLIELDGSRHIVFERLTIENSRGIGVHMRETVGCELRDCLLRNLGGVAAHIGAFDNDPLWSDMLKHPTDNQGGFRNGLAGCEIYDTAKGGVILAGGNRKTLTPGENFVRNCEMHHFNRLERTYKTAVNIYGVGNRIEHNLIRDCDAGMILLAGNDHVIEFNEFTRGMLYADEMGAIYMGRDPSEFGNIIRYNYFHHIGQHRGGHGTVCVAFDDGSAGTLVYGNIFYKTSRGVEGNGAVLQTIENNIFIENGQALLFHEWGRGWYNWTRGKHWPTHGIPKRILEDVNILEPPYSTRYPELVDAYNAPPEVIRGRVIRNNLFVDQPGDCPEGNLAVTGDPGFVDRESQKFGLKKDSEVFKKLPDFKPIPFEKIGLQRGRSE